MKKLLLSCAAVALAGSAFAAGNVNSILGTYDAGYELMYAGETSEKTETDVTITLVSGNDIEISANLFSFLSGLETIPATYNPEDGTISIAVADLDCNGRLFRYYSWVNDEDGEQLSEITLQVESDGVITTVDDEDTAWYVSDPSVQWWDYIWWGVTLYPVEVGVGGGEEPGEEPGESAGTQITISTDDSSIYRIDASTGEKTDADPASFFALIETDSDPIVSLECVNIGTGSQPNMNNMAINGDWYNLYTGNGGTLVADYQLAVEEGYVITKVEATLYSVNGDVTWFLTPDDEFYAEDPTGAGEEFTSSDNGTDLVYTCNTPVVHITTDNGSVAPVQWADFVVTVAEEGSTVVKGLESVDANAPVVFYDLQGRKVANPTKGIFIRQQGGKASKVVVK